jgi:membrane dipeptidase
MYNAKLAARLTERLAARRRFLKAAGALALGCLVPGALRAASTVPIADSHSHVGLITSRAADWSLKTQMQESGVMLLAWALVGDGRWAHRTNAGIKQFKEPVSGDQIAYFRQKLSIMRSYLSHTGLEFVQTPADIDAARAGAPHVAITLEGAGFTEDGLELLDEAHAQGLRHLQLVHYIKNGIGDIQTEPPVHNGLTELGANVIKSCNRLGILVDLAHSPAANVDRALEVSSVPMIWSHSAITSEHYDWRRSSGYSRLLYIDYAKKIAQSGGAVGLWALRATVKNSPEGYATELLRMADLIGPEHVMFGTDTDGMGTGAVMENLDDLRKVADILQERGVDDKTLKAICFDNYARCLKGAMQARTAT